MEIQRTSLAGTGRCGESSGQISRFLSVAFAYADSTMFLPPGTRPNCWALSTDNFRSRIMKKGKTVTLLCVAMLAVPIQGALAAAPEAAQKMERMQSGSMDKMHGEKMESMRATMAKIRATEDPEERARLLEQHLDQMHRRMEEMHKSMGEMMAQMDEQRVETRKLHDHRRMK